MVTVHNPSSSAAIISMSSATTAVEIIDGLPCQALLLDEDGTVIHANEPAISFAGSSVSAVGTQFYESFPEFSQPLAGDIPWLTPQDVPFTLRRGRAEWHLRLHVRRLSQGSYVLIYDETDARDMEMRSAQTARLASLGFMLAGVCHEVSNPLAATYSMVQILQSRIQTSDEMLSRGLDNIACNVRRILEVSSRVSQFSRVVDETRKLLPVDQIIDEALSMLGQGVGMQTVFISRRQDPEAVVLGRSSELRQVFFNILLNGVQALQGKGELMVEVSHSAPTESTGGEVEIKIRDSGPGVPEQHLHRILEPFFSTKGGNEGTGLGLAISYELVCEHEGDLSVDNSTEGGACFTIKLPLRGGQR